MSAVRLDGITKIFTSRSREIRAVDSVSFDIHEGETFGLLGVNGAGKTTIIRMLSGLMKPTSGDASVFGSSILTDIASVKRAVAVSPQETSVAPNLTVRENLEFIAGIYFTDNGIAKQKAAGAMETLGLKEVADRRAKTLSGGWQRRLSIAMALVSEPRVIFLDEPTLGLDVLARRELWRVIEGLKGKCTVVITSHYLEEIEHLCDRVAVLNAGKLLAVGTVDEIKVSTGKDSFEDAFVELAGGDAV